MKKTWLFLFTSFFVTFLISLLFVWLKVDHIETYKWYMGLEFPGKNIESLAVCALVLSLLGSIVSLTILILNVLKIEFLNKIATIAHIIVAIATLVIWVLLLVSFFKESSSPDGAKTIFWLLIIGQFATVGCTGLVTFYELKK